MAVNLYHEQTENVVKTWTLMTAFLVVVIALGWVLASVYDNSAILYIAVAVSILMNIASYWYSDKVVIAMAGAKPVTREENPDLWNVAENLAITAGLPMPKLYTIDDPVPNAFATGRNKEHAAIAVTTGLLSIMDRSELEGVIAHEMSHIGNKDILISTVIVVLVGFVSIISNWFTRMMVWGGRDSRRGEGGAIVALISLVFIVLSPIIATIIQLAISRKREYLADASGALLTRYPEGLASALEKIESHSGKMRRANHATAHLYISSPFGAAAEAEKKHMGFLTKLFMTHPPIEERIRVLRGMEE